MPFNRFECGSKEFGWSEKKAHPYRRADSHLLPLWCILDKLLFRSPLFLPMMPGREFCTSGLAELSFLTWEEGRRRKVNLFESLS